MGNEQFFTSDISKVRKQVIGESGVRPDHNKTDNSRPYQASLITTLRLLYEEKLWWKKYVKAAFVWA